MPRQKIAYLSDMIEADKIDDDQYMDIAFVPNEDESSDSDNATDSDIEEILSRLLPAGHYEQIKSSYNSTQKLLEPNHKYEWRENFSRYDDLLDTDADTFDPSSILGLQSKNPLELFELFFSHSMKNYIIEATTEDNFNLNVDYLELFIVFIMITIINSRKQQSDYWSNKRFLQCAIIKNLLLREKFDNRKKYIRFYKLDDEDKNDKVWKVRNLYDLFRENCMRYGFFDFFLAIDEVMVKYFGRFNIKKCIRDKPIRFGIKLWALCFFDGYIYDLDIYTGKCGTDVRNPLSSVGLGSRVVVKIFQDLLEKLKEKNSKSIIYFLIIFLPLQIS